MRAQELDYPIQDRLKLAVNLTTKIASSNDYPRKKTNYKEIINIILETTNN